MRRQLPPYSRPLRQILDLRFVYLHRLVKDAQCASPGVHGGVALLAPLTVEQILKRAGG